MNGRAFLNARDGLRGRIPLVVEWKGAHRAPGDEVVPADLRIDHVYLVSCKYLSRIVVNASPHHLFDRLLAGGTASARRRLVRRGRARGARGAVRGGSRRARLELPQRSTRSTPSSGATSATALTRAGPARRSGSTRGSSTRVADASADRWRTAIGADTESMLWRLLRIGSAPYFVLGAARRLPPLAHRNAVGLAAEFELRGSTSRRAPAGNRWWRGGPLCASAPRADVVAGHVEIRWSHGRFAGRPEAKVYLDTPHAEVPGYFPVS